MQFKNESQSDAITKTLLDYTALLDSYHHNKENRAPELTPEVLATFRLDQLNSIYSELDNRFAPKYKISSAPEIIMSSGNGVFDTFPTLALAAQQALESASMQKYKYSKPINTLINNIKNYLQLLGIKLNPPTANNVMSGNGTTHLYHHAIQVIFKRSQRKLYAMGVALIPTPAYGLFARPVVDVGGEIKPIVLQESNQMKLTPQQLEDAIINNNETLFEQYRDDINYEYTRFIKEIKKLGINEKLPVYIGKNEDINREQLEKNLNQIIDKLIQLYNANPQLKKKMEYLGLDGLPQPPAIPKVLCLVWFNPHNPTGMVYTQKEIDDLDKVRRKYDITIIEDLVHKDIIYTREIGFFAKCQQDFHKLIMLMGPSKSLCAASYRIAVAVYSEDFSIFEKGGSRENENNKIQETIFHDTMFSSPLQEAALCAAFNPDPDHQKAINDYLTTNNNEYKFRINLFRSLIHGIKNAGLSAEEKKAIENYLNSKRNKELDQLFAEGIFGVKTLTNPQGCFFAVLDFSYFQNWFLGNTPLQLGSDFYKALNAICRIDTIPSEGMLYTEKPILRCSMNCTREAICEAALRLSWLTKMFTKTPHPRVIATLRLCEAVMQKNEQEVLNCMSDAYISWYKHDGETYSKIYNFLKRLLYKAIKDGNLDFVKKYLQSELPIYDFAFKGKILPLSFSIGGLTPLHAAAKANNADMISLLIDYGAAQFFVSYQDADKNQIYAHDLTNNPDLKELIKKAYVDDSLSNILNNTYGVKNARVFAVQQEKTYDIQFFVFLPSHHSSKKLIHFLREEKILGNNIGYERGNVIFDLNTKSVKKIKEAAEKYSNYIPSLKTICTSRTEELYTFGFFKEKIKNVNINYIRNQNAAVSRIYMLPTFSNAATTQSEEIIVKPLDNSSFCIIKNGEETKVSVDSNGDLIYSTPEDPFSVFGRTFDILSCLDQNTSSSSKNSP